MIPELLRPPPKQSTTPPGKGGHCGTAGCASCQGCEIGKLGDVKSLRVRVDLNTQNEDLDDKTKALQEATCSMLGSGALKEGKPQTIKTSQGDFFGTVRDGKVEGIWKIKAKKRDKEISDRKTEGKEENTIDTSPTDVPLENVDEKTDSIDKVAKKPKHETKKDTQEILAEKVVRREQFPIKKEEMVEDTVKVVDFLNTYGLDDLFVDTTSTLSKEVSVIDNETSPVEPHSEEQVNDSQTVVAEHQIEEHPLPMQEEINDNVPLEIQAEEIIHDGKKPETKADKEYIEEIQISDVLQQSTARNSEAKQVIEHAVQKTFLEYSKVDVAQDEPRTFMEHIPVKAVPESSENNITHKEKEVIKLKPDTVPTERVIPLRSKEEDKPKNKEVAKKAKATTVPEVTFHKAPPKDIIQHSKEHRESKNVPESMTFESIAVPTIIEEAPKRKTDEEKKVTEKVEQTTKRIIVETVPLPVPKIPERSTVSHKVTENIIEMRTMIDAMVPKASKTDKEKSQRANEKDIKNRSEKQTENMQREKRSDVVPVHYEKKKTIGEEEIGHSPEENSVDVSIKPLVKDEIKKVRITKQDAVEKTSRYQQVTDTVTELIQQSHRKAHEQLQQVVQENIALDVIDTKRIIETVQSKPELNKKRKKMSAVQKPTQEKRVRDVISQTTERVRVEAPCIKTKKESPKKDSKRSSMQVANKVRNEPETVSKQKIRVITKDIVRVTEKKPIVLVMPEKESVTRIVGVIKRIAEELQTNEHKTLPPVSLAVTPEAYVGLQQHFQKMDVIESEQTEVLTIVSSEKSLKITREMLSRMDDILFDLRDLALLTELHACWAQEEDDHELVMCSCKDPLIIFESHPFACYCNQKKQQQGDDWLLAIWWIAFIAEIHESVQLESFVFSKEL